MFVGVFGPNMAGNLWSFALEKGELLSGRLRELVSSGQGLVRAQFGVELGLKPELYPSWLVLSAAAVAALLLLLLLIGASRAAVCGGGGGRPLGKKRASLVDQDGDETGKPGVNNIVNNNKSVKTEEPKKRNRKKTGDKTQSNGHPPVVAQEEVKEAVAAPKTSTQVKTEKVQEVKAPLQVKRNKKKPNTDVKPVQVLSTTDGKEPDDGAWETKVSNREKRQQRRKDKGSEDSGSPGGVEAPKPQVKTPPASATTKKKRGNNENQLSRPTMKGNPASGKGKAETLSSAPASRVEPTLNGGGWSEVSSKVTGQGGPVDGKKWSSIPASTRYRSQNDPQPWGQDSQAAWSSMDGKMKTMPLSVLQLNSADSLSNFAKSQWANQTNADDQWSGIKGSAADSTSDWNAPAEHWGNYEEPPVLMAPATGQKDQPKVLEDEKDVENPSGEAAKSKKKKNKKKKIEEEPASDTLTTSAATTHSAVTKVAEHPAPPLHSQNTSVSSSQKKSEKTVEPQKASQKKKVRRET